MTQEIVVVSALPERLPWVEGIDYQVVNTPLAYGLQIRIRDATGETFQTYTDPGTPASPPPRILSKTAFQDYAVSQLGGDSTGMARFQQIMDACEASTGAVKFCFSRYEAALTFLKSAVDQFTLIMVNAGIMTSDERNAVLNNWPEG